MKPIISPWWVYFAEKCEDVGVACGVIGGLALVGAVAWSILHIAKEIKETVPKWMVIVGVVFTCLGVLLPSQKTVLTMMTMNQITPNNIQTVSGTATDVVDYIVDKIEEIIDETEEK